MPFQITTEPFGPLPTGDAPLTEYILEHTETGEFATILPAFGGILRRLALRKGDHVFALIKAPESPQALLADESYASALLYPFPSRVHHGIYTFEGEAYALPLNELHRDNAIHGFVHGKAFTVVDQAVSDTHAQLTLRYDYAGDTAGYPFPFALTVTYALVRADKLPYGSQPANDKMCALRIHYSVQNQATTRCPAAFGWHPYFMITEDTDATAEPVDTMSLTLPDRTPIALDDKMIPTGDFPFEPAATFALHQKELDIPFRLPPTDKPYAETILTSLQTGVRLVVGQETGDGKLNYLVCYTPTRRNSIAIEPLTANADAFNNGEGLVVLEPWGELSGNIWVRLE